MKRNVFCAGGTWNETWRELRFSRCALAAALILIGTDAARALECISPRAQATLRATPSADGAPIGTLAAGTTALLVASMPRWYETKTSNGAAAFVSKRAAGVVPCPVTPSTPTEPTGKYDLHAIDVGTGLSIVVRGPDFLLVYDAGSNDDLAKGDSNRVVAYLKTLRPAVTRIDHLILSHPHRDHVELMPDLFSNFDVSNIWNSGAYSDICGYRDLLLAVADSSNTKYHTATQDFGVESIELGQKTCYGRLEPAQTLLMRHDAGISDAPQRLGANASMTFLYADGSKRASFNENSLVVRLNLGTHTILLMGDAEAGGRDSPMSHPKPSSIEGKLLACCMAELKSEVLVAAHHGSKTSSRKAFLNAVGARIFVVSSGPTKYATVTLPDDEVISALEALGTVFRTDIDDGECKDASDKIGPDEDGKDGGCNNILITLMPNMLPSGEYLQVYD